MVNHFFIGKHTTQLLTPVYGGKINKSQAVIVEYIRFHFWTQHIPFCGRELHGFAAGCIYSGGSV
jgi:hypothetical protein